MRFDDIAKLCANLTLLEREGPVRRLQEELKKAGAQRLALSLTGKVISNNLVNRDAFLGIMGRGWQVLGGVEIEFVSSNVFMFHFKNLKDCHRVLNGGSWTFDGALIAVAELMGHRTRECYEGSIVNRSNGLEELSYSAWLRATVSEKRWNRMSGFVQGFQASRREESQRSPTSVGSVVNTAFKKSNVENSYSNDEVNERSYVTSERRKNLSNKELVDGGFVFPE
ncbi:hypothetical protein QYF36_006859 [Acer negundo]|nr:hypothetical protein QYF36_006859 [Acer negundo]